MPPARARPIDAVVFDLDGTLLDTLEDIALAANRVLTARGFSPHEVGTYRRFVGDGVRALFARALPDAFRDEATIDSCVRAFREDYGRSFAIHTRPYPGVSEMLDGLAAWGVKLAILSNKPEDLTRLCVEGFLPRWRFDAVVGQKEGIAPKPDPTAALGIARTLRVEPPRVLFVGDSPVDVVTARRAGMVPGAALWGFRSRAELEEALPAFLLATPLDVLHHVRHAADRPS